eukprot:3292502-Rhodomonas_salina.2
MKTRTSTLVSPSAQPEPFQCSLQARLQATPVDITSNPAFAKLTSSQVKLSGVTGNAQITEWAKVSYPIRTGSGCSIRLKTRGPGLYLSTSSDDILSMALLMKAGHDVRLKVGSPQDPEDC